MHNSRGKITKQHTWTHTLITAHNQEKLDADTWRKKIKKIKKGLTRIRLGAVPGNLIDVSLSEQPGKKK